MNTLYRGTYVCFVERIGFACGVTSRPQFLASLWRSSVMRKADAGGGVTMLQVSLSKLECPDDATLIDRTCGASVGPGGLEEKQLKHTCFSLHV